MTGRRVVAVLSGGGVKAAAHLGAWRALCEAGLEPDAIVGTSMGALLGAALAAGRTPDELAAEVAAIRRRDIASPNPMVLLTGIRSRAVLRAEPLRRLIERLVPVRRFDQLDRPFTCTATDLDSGDSVLFGAEGQDAPLVDSLYASAALPVYYPWTTIGGRRLGDGGIRSVVPLEVAARVECDLVVAVDAGPGFEERHQPAPKHVPGLLRAHGDAMGILMAQATTRTVAWWRNTPGLPRLVYVRPPVERGVTFETGLAESYRARGYQATTDQLRRDGLAVPEG